jgi:hypothetical protein
MNTDDPANEELKRRERLAYDNASTDDAMMTSCGAHGRRRWKGDVVCLACGRVSDVKTYDKGDGVEQTVHCRCGELLITNDPVLHAKSNARVICYNCARQYRKQCGGVVPRDRLPAIRAEIAAMDAAAKESASR